MRIFFLLAALSLTVSLGACGVKGDPYVSSGAVENQP